MLNEQQSLLPYSHPWFYKIVLYSCWSKFYQSHSCITWKSLHILMVEETKFYSNQCRIYYSAQFPIFFIIWCHTTCSIYFLSSLQHVIRFLISYYFHNLQIYSFDQKDPIYSPLSVQILFIFWRPNHVLYFIIFMTHY